MTIQRAVLPVLLLVASACSHAPAKTEIAPKLGPEGSIRALYDGGMLRRRVSAHFSVEQSSYVMVAHLAGDGVIRVVYPSGATNAWVEKNHLYRTPSFTADYDAAPGYYFMTYNPMRAPGARNYSYDGRGHGFVFMITSRRPFRVDRVSDFGLWDEIEVLNYRSTLDPRTSIRQFADLVTDGVDYSIEYAHSFSSFAYTSYADAAADCAFLYTGFGGPWSYDYGYTYSNRYQPCGNNSYGYGYGYGYGYPYGYGGGYPRFPSTTPLLPPPVTEPVAQRTPRPTFTPTVPSERRTGARRGETAVAYKPTWADNPSFAPDPADRAGSRRRGSSGAGTTASRPTSTDRWPTRERSGSTSSGSSGGSSTGTSTSSGTTTTTSQPAATPTMSPGHGSSSGSGRRPPA